MNSDIRKLDKLLVALEQHIPRHALLRPEVSDGSVGWHLEHSVLVINGIVSSLLKSEPKDYRWKWSWPRVFVFGLGKIPRGRKAPERVIPKNEFDPERVHSLLHNIRSYYDRLEKVGPKHHFMHPVFGALHKRHTLRFIGLHTKHHLNIIQEIQAAGDTNQEKP